MTTTARVLRQAVLQACLLVLGCWPGVAGELVLVDTEGRPAARVAQRPDATPAEKTALAMLVEYVEQSTGARLPEATAEQTKTPGPLVYLDVDPAWEKVKDSRQGRADGFTVEVRADGLRIVGDNPPSVIWGVASVLEKYLGVRWLAPEPLWTVVPKRRPLAIPLGTYRETAGFAQRGIHIVGAYKHEGVQIPQWHFPTADWAMHNRLNRKCDPVFRAKLNKLMAERGLKPLRGGHAMAFWMPNKRFFKEHPEYYRFDGEAYRPIGGGGTQLNYANVEMGRVFAQRVVEHLRRDRTCDVVGIHLNDGYGFSVDPHSRSEWYYDEQGQPILSDSIFGFTNRVAKEVGREFPDVIVSQLAYTLYYHRPPRFPLNPNVGIHFTMYRGSAVHPMCEARNERDRRMRDELEAWRKLTARILIYEYLTGYWGEGCFASGVRMVAEDLRWYKRMGFEGAMTEYSPGKPVREMLYVYARMLWNPEQDYMDVIRDFYASAYGRGSPKMLAAYKAYWQAIRQCEDQQAGPYFAAALAQIDGFRRRVLGWIDEAEGLAAEAPEKARIRCVRREFEQLLDHGQRLAGYRLEVNRPLEPEGLLDPANAAPNPSFEEDKPTWEFSCSSADFRAEISDAAAWHGRRSLALVGPCDRPSSARPRLTISVPVEQGAWYEVQLMAKADRAAVDNFSTLFATIGGVEFFRSRRSGRIGPALLCQEWRPLSFGVCRATGDQITVSPYVARGAGTWNFDGLSVRKLAQR